MTAITADMVRRLREQTGAGMMECKRALEEAGGDLTEAEVVLAKAGQRKVQKASGRVAAEGLVVVKTSADAKTAVLLEVNSETDFVSREENFAQFCQMLAQLALTKKIADRDALLAATTENGQTVETIRQELIARIGENIQVRRVSLWNVTEGEIYGYNHRDRIAVLVHVLNGNPELGKDLAMQIAALPPEFIDTSHVPAERVAQEKEIFLAQIADMNKPAAVMEKIVEGRLEKFFAEICLVGQPSIKDPEQTIQQLLNAAKAKVMRFERIALGEGIEKVKTDFAQEVQAAAGGR